MVGSDTILRYEKYKMEDSGARSGRKDEKMVGSGTSTILRWAPFWSRKVQKLVV
jgi:hypothetical protein